MTKEKLNPYKTKSIELIAFLKFKKHKILGKIEEGQYKVAVFLETEKLLNDVQDFYNGNTAKRLFDELRNAKQFLLDSNLQT